MIPCCRGSVKLFATRFRCCPAVRLRTPRMRSSGLTRRRCARSPKSWRSRMMRNWRVAPAWSTTTQSSKRPERSGESQTGWLQLRRGASSLPRRPSTRSTESAREAVLDAIRRHLQSWLDFFSGDDSLSAGRLRQSREQIQPMTWKSLSSSSARGWKGRYSRESNHGRSISGARSSLNCNRCAASNTCSPS